MADDKLTITETRLEFEVTAVCPPMHPLDSPVPVKRAWLSWLGAMANIRYLTENCYATGVRLRIIKIIKTAEAIEPLKQEIFFDELDRLAVSQQELKLAELVERKQEVEQEIKKLQEELTELPFLIGVVKIAANEAWARRKKIIDLLKENGISL